jgi:hypothetical protein
MRRLVTAVGAACMLLAVGGIAPAQAPRAIDVAAKSGFRHRHTKVELPPTLAGLPRTTVREHEADQLDVFADYSLPALTEVYTVYIFRDVSGGVPVWFDRARWMIEHRSDLGTPTAREAEPAFVPPGRDNASGLIATYDLTGKGYRSTGVALVPIDGWYVKLRASSSSLSAGELEARMKAALAEIGWPRKLAPAAAAAAVVPCATALTLTGDAKPLEGGDEGGASALMDALVGMAAVAEAKPRREAPPQTRWCRDSTRIEGGGLYRPDARQDGYLIALADAGRGLWVGPSDGLLLLQGDEKKPKKPAFTAKLLLLGRTLTTRPYDRLLSPAQAVRIAGEGTFATTISTWGKKHTIEIGSDALK